MKQKFLGNFIFLILVNLLAKPLYIFGIDMKVQDVVGAEDYGIYFILFNFSFLFFIILDLGLTQYNSRVVAQDNSKLKTLAPNFIVAKLFLGFVFLLAILLGGFLLGYNAIELRLLLLVGLIHAFNSFIEYLRSNIAALHLFKLDAVLSIINRILLIFICGTLLYGSFASEFKIEHFIYVQIFTLCITAFLSFFVVVKQIDSFSFSLDKGLIIKIIKEGYPYALLVLLTTVYTRTDAVMLKELIPSDGETEAGYYAAAYRFLDMVSMFGLLMASQLLPMFARLIKEKDTESIRHLAQVGFKIIMFISIGVSVCLGTFGEEIIALIFDTYPAAYVGLLLSLLIFSFIPIGTSYVFGTLMNANADLKILNTMGIIGVLVNILLNFILIPKYNALGAVYATVFTQSIVAIAHIYYSNKKLDLQLPTGLFIRIILFGVLMYVLMQFGMIHLDVNWIVKIIMGGVLTLPIAWVFKLLDIEMIKEVFMRNKETE